MKPRAKNPEAGFVLLFIYAMAAIVAIMLFTQLPRVAFEAQRDKEQLLIDRGEQYSRAIQLYVRKFNKFPADFNALDNTQNLRFLRQHYKDPMTGKDEWRIIHVGPGGVFTDSLVYNKKKDDGSQQKEQQTFITEMQQTGGNPVDPNQNINVATRQRQSDQPGAAGDPNNPNQPPQFDANGNVIQPPTQVLPNGQIVPAGQQGIQPGTQPGFPGQPQFNANGTPMAPGQPFPGQAGVNSFGQQNPSQPFGGVPNGFGQQPNGQPGGAPGNAASVINQLLTTPRPGGLNGVGGVDPNAAQAGGGLTATIGGAPGTPIQAGTAQNVIGGGIAGVASKLEESGIKIYNEQKSYNKWEFVYDITKDPARTGATAIPAQQNANGQNANGQNPNNQSTGVSTSNAGAPGGAGGFGGLTGTTTTTPPPTPQPGVTPPQ